MLTRTTETIWRDILNDLSFLQDRRRFRYHQNLSLLYRLSYLTIADSQLETEIQWTNDDVEKICMKTDTSRLRMKCSLIVIYHELWTNCSKLNRILDNSVHRRMSILIMSIFFDMTLMLERVSRYHVSISMYLNKTVLVNSSFHHDAYFFIQSINIDFSCIVFLRAFYV